MKNIIVHKDYVAENRQEVLVCNLESFSKLHKFSTIDGHGSFHQYRTEEGVPLFLFDCLSSGHGANPKIIFYDEHWDLLENEGIINAVHIGAGKYVVNESDFLYLRDTVLSEWYYGREERDRMREKFPNEFKKVDWEHAGAVFPRVPEKPYVYIGTKDLEEAREKHNFEFYWDQI